MVRVHTLTLALMRVKTLAETAHAIAAALTEDFHTDLVRLVLFRADLDLPAAQWLIAEPAGAAAFPAFAEFFKRADPPAAGQARLLVRGPGERSAFHGAAADRRGRHAGRRQP